MDNLTKQGADAFKAGNKDEARKLLLAAVKQNSDSERAWGWLYNVTKNDKERTHCLNQMLRINPENGKVKELLDQITNYEPPLESSQNVPPTNNIQNQVSEKKKFPTWAKISLSILGGIVGIVVLCNLAVFGLNLAGPQIEKNFERIDAELSATSTPESPIVPQSPQTATPISAVAPQLGTFDNPVPIGSGYKYPGLGTFTVIESEWLSGQTGFAIVKLSLTCERPASQECDLVVSDRFTFDALGNSGNGYSQEFNSAIPEPDFASFINPPLYGGGTETGYVGFLITNNENSLLMRVQPFLEDSYVYFKISP